MNSKLWKRLMNKKLKFKVIAESKKDKDKAKVMTEIMNYMFDNDVDRVRTEFFNSYDSLLAESFWGKGNFDDVDPRTEVQKILEKRFKTK